MADRIRGQETTLQFVVDGKLLEGSFAKVTDWKMTPRAELPEVGFCGETEDDVDFMHHGYDFNCSVQELDPAVMDLYDDLVARNRAGQEMPKIQIIAIHKYRSTVIPSKTQILKSVKLKLDEHGAGGRKDYVKNTLSGKCKTKDTI